MTTWSARARASQPVGLSMGALMCCVCLSCTVPGIVPSVSISVGRRIAQKDSLSGGRRREESYALVLASVSPPPRETPAVVSRPAPTPGPAVAPCVSDELCRVVTVAERHALTRELTEGSRP